jgi:hypothetical protein
VAIAPQALLSPTQAPKPLHVPAALHASMPLAQGPLKFLGVAWHAPVAATQAPVAQAFVRVEQSFAAPLHAPPEQTSPAVQRSPSLQDAVFGVYWQPTAALQTSSVQGLLSLHTSGVLEHAAVVGLHESFVHLLPSSQLFVVSTTHVPLKHELVVQALPSSHSVLAFVTGSTSGCLPYWHVVPPTQTVPPTFSQALGVVQATAQQDPPTQWAFVHSESLEHVPPLSFRHSVPSPFVSVEPAGQMHLPAVHVAAGSHVTAPQCTGPEPPAPAWPPSVFSPPSPAKPPPPPEPSPLEPPALLPLEPPALLAPPADASPPEPLPPELLPFPPLSLASAPGLPPPISPPESPEPQPQSRMAATASE